MGGEPLWSETQQVAIGKDGTYSVLLGLATEGGVPASIFTAGAARWLGVSIERAAENGRTPLVSVAYAMKSGDAETVGGVPAADLVTKAQLAAAARTFAAPSGATGQVTPQVAPSGAGAANVIPLWTTSSALGNSVISQEGTAAAPTVGINTSSPVATLDVAGTGNFQSNLSLSTGVAATSSAGVNSPMLSFEGASDRRFGLLHTSIPQVFAWQLTPVANNTILPSSNLSLLYGSSVQTATPTGLSIGATGIFSFAPGQTFPGVVTPGASNTFTALQSFTGGLTAGSLTIQPRSASSGVMEA